MSSVNDSFPSGSRVNLLDHPPSSPSPTQRRNRTLIKFFFCFLIFLALITGAILLSLVHKQIVNSRNQFNSKQADAAVEIFCSVTLHLPECVTSLSSSSVARSGSKKIDPDDIFCVSLMLASDEVNKLASLTKSLILISTDSRSGSALQKCASLIDDSLDRLNRSLTSSAGYSLLAREDVRDMIVWVNGSVSDLRTCFILQEKDESRAVDEFRGGLQMAITHASNSFEFLQNRDGIVAMIESWNDQNPEPVVDYEYLSLLCMFCPQYLVLFLLYFLLLRKY